MDPTGIRGAASVALKAQDRPVLAAIIVGLVFILVS